MRDLLQHRGWLIEKVATDHVRRTIPPDPEIETARSGFVVEPVELAPAAEGVPDVFICPLVSEAWVVHQPHVVDNSLDYLVVTDVDVVFRPELRVRTESH